MQNSCIFIGTATPSLRKRFAALARPASEFPAFTCSESDLAAWMEWVSPSSGNGAPGAPVLLIAADQFTAAAWAFVRVRLAESGRFFVALLPPAAGTAAVVEALREGAYDAVAEDEALDRWRSAFAAVSAAERLWTGLFATPETTPTDGLIGRSRSMEKLRELIRRVGPSSATVLVLGESGTGKERVAQALHSAHPDAAKRPFIAINCTALPRDLLEGELFGAAKGAYTGAVADRPGLVEQADGGTLFLDEIGDLDRALQPKLLRFLESRRARRLGGKADYGVDVRIVAATNADLRARVAAGLFREDLYYRLADISLELAPLRDRAEDIPLLCRHFLAAAAERHDRLVTSIEPALLERFQTWSWPGNIRELRSTIERLVLLAHGPVLRANAWSPPVPSTVATHPRLAAATDHAAPAPSASHAPSSGVMPTATDPVATPLNKRQRRELALRLLEESGGDQTWVSARLGIHPSTLYRWRTGQSKKGPPL